MKISKDRLRQICTRRGICISDLLKLSGVSRNAFYSLARKENILPRSVTAIAATLDVAPSDILETGLTPREKSRKLRRQLELIKKRHKDVDPDNVRHTLQLLEKKPLDRLRNALIRAQI